MIFLVFILNYLIMDELKIRDFALAILDRYQGQRMFIVFENWEYRKNANGESVKVITRRASFLVSEYFASVVENPKEYSFLFKEEDFRFYLDENLPLPI